MRDWCLFSRSGRSTVPPRLGADSGQVSGAPSFGPILPSSPPSPASTLACGAALAPASPRGFVTLRRRAIMTIPLCGKCLSRWDYLSIQSPVCIPRLAPLTAHKASQLCDQRRGTAGHGSCMGPVALFAVGWGIRGCYAALNVAVTREASDFRPKALVAPGCASIRDIVPGVISLSEEFCLARLWVCPIQSLLTLNLYHYGISSQHNFHRCLGKTQVHFVVETRLWSLWAGIVLGQFPAFLGSRTMKAATVTIDRPRHDASHVCFIHSLKVENSPIAWLDMALSQSSRLRKTHISFL